MSNVIAQPKNVKPLLATAFGLVFLFNVVMFVFAILVALKGGEAPRLVPANTGVGVRLIIFIVGCALSWVMGRWLCQQLILGQRPLHEAVNASYVLLFYLLLVFSAVAFFGGFTWLLQGVFLVILLLLTLFGLARVLGIGMTLGIIVFVLAIGVAQFFILG